MKIKEQYLQACLLLLEYQDCQVFQLVLELQENLGHQLNQVLLYFLFLQVFHLFLEVLVVLIHQVVQDDQFHLCKKKRFDSDPT